jgi:predicted amidohydrolase YtcJ
MSSDHAHGCAPHPAIAGLVNHSETVPTARPGESPQTDMTAAPSHIFIGSIITMDDSRPQAGALAIGQGKILAVGSAEEVKATAGPDTKIIELGSQTLYPGLIEPHMHLWVTAINYDWLDCSAFTNKTVGDVKQKLAEAVAGAKPGEWILGKLFDPSLLPGNPDLTLQDLDPIAPDNPMLILNASMHFAYVNSKALELAGIKPDSPDPDGGTYGRDEAGKLNGILSEMSAIAPLLQHIDTITPEAVAANAAKITNDAAKVGVTTMREAATGALFGPKEIGLLHHLQQQDKLKTRVSLALVDDVAKTWPEAPETVYLAGDENVWVGARKLVSDGSNQGKSGYQSQPYLHSDDRGKLDMTPEALRERIGWCHENGWQVMVHANGDAAVETVVNAFSDVLASAPEKDLRHRIEHCSLVNDDALFEKMHSVGVSPSFLINHVYYWGKTLRDNALGKDRIGMLDRTAAALDAGLRFTMHSDYNVSPIAPLHYVKVAATRTTWDGGEVLGKDQRVSVGQALKAITIDAAWQLNADDRLGSLTPGKFADFVILDKDPQQVEPEKIDDIKIVQTWRNGSITYQ